MWGRKLSSSLSPFLSSISLSIWVDCLYLAFPFFLYCLTFSPFCPIFDLAIYLALLFSFLLCLVLPVSLYPFLSLSLSRHVRVCCRGTAPPSSQCNAPCIGKPFTQPNINIIFESVSFLWINTPAFTPCSFRAAFRHCVPNIIVFFNKEIS